MNKAIFLDRDGTINVDFGYVHKVEDLKFIPRAIEALRKLQSLGFLLIIITNQSGIGRGYYSMADFKNFMRFMFSKFEKEGIIITDTYICPHHPASQCKCRKPKTHYYNQAIKKFDVDVRNSFVIGDKTEDIKSGENIGARTILVQTGKGGRDNLYKIKPNYITKDLYEAGIWVQKNSKQESVNR